MNGKHEVETTWDLLIVGGGPAGLAACSEALRLGLTVGLVDERPTLGGQIFKQLGTGFHVKSHAALGRDHRRGRALIDAVERSQATLMTRTTALAIEGTTVVLATDGRQAKQVTAGRVLLAPGAHDRPVVFPGWTLPGVITAGGAQTLVKTQRVSPGTRIVMAGSGPLALAFPAQLRHYGVNVVLALEAGPAPRPRDLARMARAAGGNTGLLRDAAAYRSELLRHRVPLRYRRIVVRAEGSERVETVVHAAVDADWRVLPGTEERVEADTLCIGYGFVPSTELFLLAGCRFGYDEDRGGAVVERDAWMRTSVDGVLAAGDGTGIAGSYVATDTGRVAAIGAALDLGMIGRAQADEHAAPYRASLEAKERFRLALQRMHAVGPGIHELSTPETVVCRCEEVPRSEIDRAVTGSADINVVKSLTRAGMGLCQGRSCQRHIAARIAAFHGVPIGSVEPATARLPARPVPLGVVADPTIGDGGFFTR